MDLDDLPTPALILDRARLARNTQAMTERADGEGLDLATFCQDAVRSYAARAAEEEWVTLLGQIGKSADPAAIFIKRAFASVVQPACDIHGR